MSDIAVVGPGAIGVVTVASLEQTGRHRLQLHGRRPRNGFTVEWGDRVAPVDTPVVTAVDAGAVDAGAVDAGAVDAEASSSGVPADLVVLAVKAHQTAGAADRLRALRGPQTPVLVLQNGVEHAERLTGLVPADAVIPGIVWCTAEEVGDGQVVVRPGDRYIEVPAGAAADTLMAQFAGGPLEIRPIDDFRTAAWIKLIYNATVAVEPLTLRRAEVFADNGIRRLAHQLAVECVAVAIADGARIPSDFADQVIDRLAAVPGDHGTSILYDRLADRPMEWDARNGVIARIGAVHGVPTPISDVIVPLLAAAGPIAEHQGNPSS